MKIAFVFDGLGVGGIERVGLDYIRIVKSLGHSVDIFNLAPKNNEMYSQIPKDVSIHEFFLSKRMCPETYSYGIQKWWWGKYVYPLISFFVGALQIFYRLFCKREHCDVSIAFSGHINDINFITKRFVISSKKIVWCHGNILSYLAICDAYSLLYRKVDSLVTLSCVGQKDIYPGHSFFYNKLIRNIYNPTFIADKKLSKQKVDELRDRFGDYVLMIARAEWQKGHDVAIKAMKELRNRGIKKNILFLGNGPDIEQIKQCAEKEEMSEQCFFLGNQLDVQNYIAASYINLLSSRWEGLPTVIVEAMTLGKPCVMTNCDDGEVSENGKYCILTHNEDYVEIAEALKLLYTDTKEYVKVSHLSIENAKKFSPERIKKEIDNLFHDLFD